jgi:hypothetical protein
MSTETLNFKITLSGTFWDKRPKFSIWIDDTKIQDGEIASNEHQIIEFAQEVTEESDHQLKIRLENKEDTDVVQENGSIVKDMLLNIESIEIDDISLENLIWSQSKYYPDQKKNIGNEEVDYITNCINLGWNGSYVMEFSSPFYIWLLTNT